MYDNLQLNDMLVPELQDIAEQLAIPNFKKLEKQDLVEKILGKQSADNAASNDGEEKPKRKRTALKAAPAAKPLKLPKKPALLLPLNLSKNQGRQKDQSQYRIKESRLKSRAGRRGRIAAYYQRTKHHTKSHRFFATGRR